MSWLRPKPKLGPYVGKDAGKDHIGDIGIHPSQRPNPKPRRVPWVGGNMQLRAILEWQKISMWLCDMILKICYSVASSGIYNVPLHGILQRWFFFGNANVSYSKSRNITLCYFYNSKYIMPLCDMILCIVNTLYTSEMIK